MSHSYIVKKIVYCLYLTLYWETVALEIDSTSGWLLDHCLETGNTAVHGGRIHGQLGERSGYYARQWSLEHHPVLFSLTPAGSVRE